MLANVADKERPNEPVLIKADEACVLTTNQEGRRLMGDFTASCHPKFDLVSDRAMSSNVIRR